MANKTLNDLRDEIDAIDDEIMQLISRRAKCAQTVAEIKQADSESNKKIKFYRPEREAAVLKKIIDKNPGPLHADEMARLFREIMSACLHLEEKLSIAYLGPEGTFTQDAALKHFGNSVKTRPLASIDEVFREVEARSVSFGVVPVENSTEGVVNHTLDSFIKSELSICGEVSLRIHHFLLSKHSKKENIKSIYSHPQSLAQCREWLDANLPNVDRIPVSSNAEAARIASVTMNAAAVASESSADVYGLQIIDRNIEDHPNNTTRFLIIGHQEVPFSGDDRTSILASTANRPGALYNLLSAFAQNDVSLTRIESRPSQSVNWEYVFFFDLDGHVSSPSISNALNLLESQDTYIKVLGAYPKAVL